MSVTHIPDALRRLVEERARHRCEYCLLPAAMAFFPHEVDHVINGWNRIAISTRMEPGQYQPRLTSSPRAESVP